MYSHEITNIMNQQNFNIDHNTYINIIQTSPQIDHVIYKPFGDYYEMWAKMAVIGNLILTKLI